MILGIGTDLVLIERIDGVLQRQGERFARRILTDEELRRFQLHRQPVRYLAKRYAAKEAILKALGTGLAAGLTWHCMQIDNDSAGAPIVILRGMALQRLEQGGGGRMLLSLSDERDQALAFAVWSAG